MNVVFMGSPDFALPTLRALAKQHELVGVVTQPDRPAGRGRDLKPPPVKREAGRLSSPVVQLETLKSDSARSRLAEWEPAVIVVAAYGQILPTAVLELPPHGCLNVHASLLPRWRGAAPIQAAILHGDSEAGVTIMKMDEGIDTGPLLAQSRTAIGSQETGGELGERLAQMGAELLLETLPSYVTGELEPVPQDDQEATYAPMLAKKDGALDFRQSADRLARKVRAFNPWPGTYFYWGRRRIAVHQASTEASQELAEPGTGSTASGWPAVHCRDGLLVLRNLQPAGKRAMSGQAFLNGAQGFPGDRMELPVEKS